MRHDRRDNVAPVPPLARTIAARFAARPEVVAVALGGSRAAGGADGASDLDLYVYADPAPPVADRAAIAGTGARGLELDVSPWEAGDVWVDTETGLIVDVMYRTPGWIADQLDRVLVRHEASVGYSTCFWHNVLTSTPLADRDGWFAALQARADQPYPEALRRNVIALNHPLLRSATFSFLAQIERAVARGDGVAVGHRVAALLASFFDVLFTLNRLPHPGEKRLVAEASRCPLVPPDLAARVDDLLRAAAPPWTAADPVAAAHRLIDGLDAVLRADGVMPGEPASPA